jgi:outer membrane protein OmpA-like peptidoglycan-associated protein
VKRLFLFMLLSATTCAEAMPALAEEMQAKDIACSLDPKCAKPKTRGLDFSNRGVRIEGEHKEEPLSVNLYVNFAYDSAELTQDARITLDQLGTALRDPRLASFNFRIAGHTDAKGSDAYNQSLSERRAAAVRSYMTSQFGITPTRLSSVGYGKTRLLDPSRPEDGVNRRVQVINVGE